MRRRFGEDKVGVSPVVAVVLMVAITVVLAGMLYYWVGTTAPTTDENIAYVGYDSTTYTNDWKIEIKKVVGTSISLNEVNFLISDRSGVVYYTRNLNDVNPPNFMIDNSMIYPLAENGSGVISSKTALPVTAGDDHNDYIGAVFLFMDFDNNMRLSNGDLIRIFGDVNGDGINEIQPGHNFIIKDSTNTQQYIKCQL